MGRAPAITRNSNDILEVMRAAKGRNRRLVHRLRQGNRGLPAIANAFAATPP